MNIQDVLFNLQDPEYRLFHARLMPTIDIDAIIGIRIPVLRKFAKEFAKTDDASIFLRTLPHQYYEENNLHGLIIETFKDFGKAVSAIDEFLPYIDNWATCDTVSPKVFRKHSDELLPYIYKWIKSDKPFTIRYGIGCLMNLFLDEKFDIKYAEIVSSVKSNEYYVNMMIAWYFATALSKQYNSVISFFEKQCLDDWTHNKAIQKSIESYRISDEQKSYLKTLKIQKVK